MIKILNKIINKRMTYLIYIKYIFFNLINFVFIEILKKLKNPIKSSILVYFNNLLQIYIFLAIY